MDTFSGYHPLINFTYFVIVIGLSMFYMHPVFLALSLIGSVSYSIYLKGRKTVKVFLLGMLPVCLLAAAANRCSACGATDALLLKRRKSRHTGVDRLRSGFGADAGGGDLLVFRLP